MEYIKITKENIDLEHICCAMSGKQSLAKKEWMKNRFEDGLVFYRSKERGKCFIEYIPAENAWIPIESGGYIFINCLWIASVIESIAVNFDLSPASLFLFFYIRYCEFDCFIGTDCLAVAAAYTVHAVGIPPDGNV